MLNRPTIAEFRRSQPEAYRYIVDNNLGYLLEKHLDFGKKDTSTEEECRMKLLQIQSQLPMSKNLKKVIKSYHKDLLNRIKDMGWNHLLEEFGLKETEDPSSEILSKFLLSTLIEICKLDALKYHSKLSWSKESTFLSNIASMLLQNKLMGICEYTEWNKELCIKDAQNYKYSIDWQKNSPIAWRIAYQNKWLPECTKHMSKKEKPKDLSDRIKDGLEIAREKGKKIGRKTGSILTNKECIKKYPKLFEDLKKGMSLRVAAKTHLVSRGTVSKVKKLISLPNETT